MLTELLGLLDKGVSYSQDELARLTGSSRDAVMAQIDYLARLGYLKKSVPQTGGGCSGGGCKGCSGCGTASPGGVVIWERVKDV